MAIFKKTYRFKSDIKTIWELMTDIKDQKWRSNLTNIEIFDDGKHFIEHSFDGYATDYQVKVFEPYERIEINIENSYIEGSYLIIFGKVDDLDTKENNKKTEMTFIYDVEAKLAVQKPFIKNYIEAQMLAYIKDLCAALCEDWEEKHEEKSPYSSFNNLSLGIVVGLLLGVLIDNYALGICIGIAIAVGIGLVKK